MSAIAPSVPMMTTITVDKSEIFSDRPKVCQSWASWKSLPYHSVVKPVHHLFDDCSLNEYTAIMTVGM